MVDEYNLPIISVCDVVVVDRPRKHAPWNRQLTIFAFIGQDKSIRGIYIDDDTWTLVADCQTEILFHCWYFCVVGPCSYGGNVVIPNAAWLPLMGSDLDLDIGVISAEDFINSDLNQWGTWSNDIICLTTRFCIYYDTEQLFLEV